jgi:hypothetical protein
MALNQDFKEFLSLLNKHEVKYLVVGGYSVAVHGHPRYTKDLLLGDSSVLWYIGTKVTNESPPCPKPSNAPKPACAWKNPC